MVSQALKQDPAQYSHFQAKESKMYLRQLGQQYGLEKRFQTTFWDSCRPSTSTLPGEFLRLDQV
jgi:hypothetical protein